MTNNENPNQSNIIPFPKRFNEDGDTAEDYGLSQFEFERLLGIMDALLQLPDDNLDVLYSWIRNVVES
ncbi:hypothetical protein [Methylobacter sp. BlB1]|uniref:hypothetical protein n=1 Tax=Methylobacter sp. BlB1 TaxID=2785914 RepID=UPI0018932E05|nr:hypothetical protein [Methylobacter sp. BlB1]MBF6648997.1 hypothetical protein [Methylobacter sp. BlB1]